MDSKLQSTIVFKSNLQIVSRDIIQEDLEFCSNIVDPSGLELMKLKGWQLTKIQEEEYDKCSLHCIYAPEGDYPFGTVINEAGQKVVLCKCINTECKNFKKCRPDFNIIELEAQEKITEQNVLNASVLNEVDNTPSENVICQNETDARESLSDKNENEKNVEVEILEVSETTNKYPLETVEIKNPFLDIPEERFKISGFNDFKLISQQEIISLAPDVRCVINAGPGTGKTWTLIERIKHLLMNESVDPETILVLCFSRAAVDVIKRRLIEAAEREEISDEWQLVDVRTFDSFCTYMISSIQEYKPELIPENYSLESEGYDERIKTAVKILKGRYDLLEQFQHIIVDEVQDLVGCRAELVLELLKILPSGCGFTLLGDSCQSLYDYLSKIDESVMSSEEFYQHLFSDFSNISYFTLKDNYRQSASLNKLAIPYRAAILSKNPDKETDIANNLLELINDVNLEKLSYFNEDIAKEYTKNNSTLGILTRTNGQALLISSWLRANQVEHELQKPMCSRDYAEWIAKIILSMKSDVMNEKEFTDKFVSFYPSASDQVELYWKALTAGLKNHSGSVYDIEEILKGILRNPKDVLLFEEPSLRKRLITVSNIHRAKGREFDNVILIDNILCQISDENNCGNNIEDLEHKVCYVAVTRPKKSLEKIHMDEGFIYTLKDESRKCYKSGGYFKKKFLSHYEIDTSDFEVTSFAQTKETQNFIKSKLQQGAALRLLKCAEDTRPYVTYKLVPEDNENIILGYTTEKFATGMEKAMQNIYQNYKKLAYKYFRNAFMNIYVDGLTTCISTANNKLDGAIKYGNMYIWYGISVSGFAQVDKSLK